MLLPLLLFCFYYCYSFCCWCCFLLLFLFFAFTVAFFLCYFLFFHYFAFFSYSVRCSNNNGNPLLVQRQRGEGQLKICRSCRVMTINSVKFELSFIWNLVYLVLRKTKIRVNRSNWNGRGTRQFLRLVGVLWGSHDVVMYRKENLFCPGGAFLYCILEPMDFGIRRRKIEVKNSSS